MTDPTIDTALILERIKVDTTSRQTTDVFLNALELLAGQGPDFARQAGLLRQAAVQMTAACVVAAFREGFSLGIAAPRMPTQN